MEAQDNISRARSGDGGGGFGLRGAGVTCPQIGISRPQPIRLSREGNVQNIRRRASRSNGLRVGAAAEGAWIFQSPVARSPTIGLDEAERGSTILLPGAAGACVPRSGPKTEGTRPQQPSPPASLARK